MNEQLRRLKVLITAEIAGLFDPLLFARDHRNDGRVAAYEDVLDMIESLSKDDEIDHNRR